METLLDRKVELTLRSSFGCISKNTIDSIVNKLKRKDGSLREIYDRGRISSVMGDCRIAYLKTSLTRQEIINEIHDFIQKYDYLTIGITVKK